MGGPRINAWTNCNIEEGATELRFPLSTVGTNAVIAALLLYSIPMELAGGSPPGGKPLASVLTAQRSLLLADGRGTGTTNSKRQGVEEHLARELLNYFTSESSFENQPPDVRELWLGAVRVAMKALQEVPS